MPRKGENIYKRKDGRWEGRYIKGRKKNGAIYYGYVYGEKYQQVKQQLFNIKVQYLVKQDQEMSEYAGTFQEWGNYWLETIVAPTVKRSTYTSYESKLTIHLFPILEDKELRKITVEDIQQVVKELEKGLKMSSVHSAFRILRTCLNAAVKEQRLLRNPCDSVVLPPIKKSRLEALEQEEHQKIKKIAMKDKNGLPILLSLETGMRLGEICGLKWSDIDFDKQTIYVQRTLQRLSLGNGSTTIIEGPPKTLASYRKIPLSDYLSELLKEKKNQSRGDYVISNTRKPVEPRVVQYRFKKIAKQANLSEVTFHTLRHSFATRCLELGVNVATISTLLGHSSTKMTLDVYTHSSRSEERAAIAQLSKF